MRSYVLAALNLSRTNVDVINVQHEYGLFGGVWGENILMFYAATTQPVITTLHSVISNPDATLRRVTRKIADASSTVIVMANAAIEILVRDYGIAASKLRLIPHGIPTVSAPLGAHDAEKTTLGYSDRTLLSTFGLLGPDKGIEYALRALPGIIRRWPAVLFLIIGQTHPNVIASSGEAYRTHLQNLVVELKLEAHVAFVDKYLAQPELLRYLVATDIYIIPHLNPLQIVSGSLAYAMGAGRAVVSTACVHAREVLANAHGMLIPFRDSPALAASLHTLLADPALRRDLEARAFARSRGWLWPTVGQQYLDVFVGAAR